MWYYVLLCVSPVFACLQSVAQKQYNLRSKQPDVILFSAVTCLIALVFFVLTSGLRIDFDARVVPYSLAFAACYASAWVATVYAVRYGPIAITSLIISLALVFPVLQGVLLGEAVTIPMALGFALLIGAMVLSTPRGDGEGGFTVKWFVWTLIAFLGNGGCMIASNMQKRVLGEGYSHPFMILALAVAFATLFALSVVKNRGVSREALGCLPYASLNGASNGLMNLIILTVIGHIPNTVLYPTNAALGMLLTFLLAYFIYKERFTRAQYVGYALGVVSVALLNL